jgi:hypothetical protein
MRYLPGFGQSEMEKLKEKNRSVATICRLCLKEAKLVKSHILPEFLYRPMYGAGNRFFVISTDAMIPERTRQVGIFERLFCSNCDNKLLGRYENYAARVLMGGTGGWICKNGQRVTDEWTGLRQTQTFLFVVALAG